MPNNMNADPRGEIVKDKEFHAHLYEPQRSEARETVVLVGGAEGTTIHQNILSSDKTGMYTGEKGAHFAEFLGGSETTGGDRGKTLVADGLFTDIAAL
jgi:hypothetical protein